MLVTLCSVEFWLVTRPQLFVYGVNENTSNSELQEAFARYGNVVDTYNTGKGYAFVTFDNKEDASTVGCVMLSSLSLRIAELLF